MIFGIFLLKGSSHPSEVYATLLTLAYLGSCATIKKKKKKKLVPVHQAVKGLDSGRSC